MVKVLEDCAKNYFQTEYPFVFLGSCFLILCIIIPHIFVTDFYTKIVKQEEERSISYTWTFGVSVALIVLFIGILAGALLWPCYEIGSYTYVGFVIFIFLAPTVAIINNANFGDLSKNQIDKNGHPVKPSKKITREIINFVKGLPTNEPSNGTWSCCRSKGKYKPLLNKFEGNTPAEAQWIATKIEEMHLKPDQFDKLHSIFNKYIDMIQYQQKRVQIRKMSDRDKLISGTHKFFAFTTFSLIMVVNTFLLVGEKTYAKPGNDMAIAIATYVASCISLFLMIYELVRHSITKREYAWNGLVSYYERAFVLTSIILFIGTPKE